MRASTCASCATCVANNRLALTPLFRCSVGLYNTQPGHPFRSLCRKCAMTGFLETSQGPKSAKHASSIEPALRRGASHMLVRQRAHRHHHGFKKAPLCACSRDVWEVANRTQQRKMLNSHVWEHFCGLSKPSGVLGLSEPFVSPRATLPCQLFACQCRIFYWSALSSARRQSCY